MFQPMLDRFGAYAVWSTCLRIHNMPPNWDLSTRQVLELEEVLEMEARERC